MKKDWHHLKEIANNNDKINNKQIQQQLQQQQQEADQLQAKNISCEWKPESRNRNEGGRPNGIQDKLLSLFSVLGFLFPPLLGSSHIDRGKLLRNVEKWNKQNAYEKFLGISIKRKQQQTHKHTHREKHKQALRDLGGGDGGLCGWRAENSEKP